MTERVLVLDGDTRAALACVRSLIDYGCKVFVVSASSSSLAGVSRGVFKSINKDYSSLTPDEFREWLLSTLKENEIDVLIPITDRTLDLVLRVEEDVRGCVAFPFINRETFLRLSNKFQLLQDAQSLGINVPKTFLITDAKDSHQIETCLRQVVLPVVVKLRSSSEACDLSLREVCYFDSKSELRSYLEALSSGIGFIVQQRIEGIGVGVFSICDKGEGLAFFGHKRLLEKPPSGGVSVLSESESLEELPLCEVKKLLSFYNFDGISMAEFKRTSKGDHYLIEINPRFWGSLQLAIDCGRDFPKLLVDLVRSREQNISDENIKNHFSLENYSVGKRLRWEFGTVDHFLICFKKEGFKVFKNVFFRNSLCFRLRTSFEVFRLKDPRPFFTEARDWFLKTISYLPRHRS